MTDSRNRDTAALVSVDLATKKQTLIAEDAKADAGEVHVPPDPAQPAGRGVQLPAHHVEGDRSVDPGDLDALGKLEGGEVHIMSRTLDDRTWIAALTSDQNRASTTCGSRQEEVDLPVHVAPDLENQPLVKMWPVVIESHDHLPLVSYLSLPAIADPDGDGKANQPVPMVLLVHGGPWGATAGATTRSPAARQPRLRRAFGQLPGLGRLRQEVRQRRQPRVGQGDAQDLIDAVQWAIDQKIAPKDQIAIMGGSYGGYATLAGLTMTPDVSRVASTVARRT